MDDVIKKLIYNSKLILFMHSAYIIKPYMCYNRSRPFVALDVTFSP